MYFGSPFLLIFSNCLSGACITRCLFGYFVSILRVELILPPSCIQHNQRVCAHASKREKREAVVTNYETEIYALQVPRGDLVMQRTHWTGGQKKTDAGQHVELLVTGRKTNKYEKMKIWNIQKLRETQVGTKTETPRPDKKESTDNNIDYALNCIQCKIKLDI